MNKNEYWDTRASFLLSVCPQDKIESTWDSEVTGKGQNSYTWMVEFYIIYKTPICELH